jgi:hypothetical protein
MMSGASTGPVPGSPVPASAIERLTLIADNVVNASGGVAPAWVSAVVTTREQALTSTDCGTVFSGQQTIVYLVSMQGQFVSMGSRPPGVKAPTDSYLFMVINAGTFARMDWGLRRGPPPAAPASLGPVSYLKRQRLDPALLPISDTPRCDQNTTNPSRPG